MDDEKTDRINLAVDAIWMLLCTAGGIGFWGAVMEALSLWISIRSPYWLSAAFLAFINAGHFGWGLFHVPEGVSDVAPTRTGLMMSLWEHERLEIRIPAILTVAPSVYLQQILASRRANAEEESP